MSSPRRPPSMSPLIAFEATARLNSVTLAAAELNTSQSAISRHIRNLEERLKIQLFQRDGRGISLTSDGNTYFEAVSVALCGLRAAETRLSQSRRSLTIACSYTVGHLVIMPNYARLRNLLGEDIAINLLTFNYEGQSIPEQPNADILIGYRFAGPGGQPQKILDEDIIPVASPNFIREHRDILEGPASGWTQLRLLEITQNSLGWATWNDWFRAKGFELGKAPDELFSNYVYLLEAAAAGNGIALGWRGFIERQLKNGTLEFVGNSWLSTNNCIWAWLTQQGQQKRSAQLCMQFLAGFREKQNRQPQK